MDETELARSLQAKAGEGDAEAMYELGWRHALGMGLPYDEAEGIRWLRQAAEAGQMLARNNLGARYLAGDGVPQDSVEACVWFTLAAAQGDRKAGKNRDSVAATLSPEQIEAVRVKLEQRGGGGS